MEKRTVLQWDKDDCAYMGLVKFDLLGLGMLAALQHSFDLAAEHVGERWSLETVPKEEQGVYDQLVPGGRGRGVPGGVARADGAAAPLPPAPVLRPRDRGRPDPARPDPGRRGAPDRAAAARRRAGHLPPPAARAGAEPHPRDPDLPGAADADRDGGRRLLGRGRGPAASGHGQQARDREDRVAAGEALRGDGRQRHHRGDGRRDLHEDPGLRELRLRGEPLAVVRAARLRVRVDAAALPRGVPRLPPPSAADGLLLARLPHRGRQAARRRRAPAGHQPLARGRGHGGDRGRRSLRPRRLPPIRAAAGAGDVRPRCARAGRRAPGATARSRYGSGSRGSPASGRGWRTGSSRSGWRTATTATSATSRAGSG